MKEKRKPMIVETMTLTQVVDALRGLGIRTSEDRVSRMLMAGAYPWGVCVQGPKSLIVEIYTKKFWAWVDEIAEEDTDYKKNSPAAATAGPFKR